MSLMDILWKVSLQAGILAVIVWAVTRLAKNAPARLRHALWALVLIKFMVPPFAHFPAEWVFWQRPTVNASMPSEMAQQASPYVQPRPSVPQVSSVASGAPTVAVSRNLPAAHESIPIDWPLCLWLTGVAIMLLALMIRWLRQRRMVRSSVAADGDTLEALRTASQRVRMRQMPDLRISDLAATPMVVGLLRQTILLPEEISSSCGEADLQAMLLHELAHVKRRDMMVLWLQQLAQVIFFFHPAIWLTGRELKRERELACDELVLSASGMAPKDYAAGYVAALKLAAGSAVVASVSLGMAEPMEMEQRRLEGILHRPIGRLTLGWVAALFVACAIGIPTFIGCAQPLVKGRHSIKSGFVLSYVKPLVWRSHGVKLSILGIGRSSKYNPKTGKDDLVLHVEIHGQSGTDALGVDLSGFKLKLDSGQTLVERKYDFPGCDHIYFPLPPKGTRSVEELTGDLSCPAKSVQHKTGPISFVAALNAVEVQKGVLTVAVADWSIGQHRNYRMHPSNEKQAGDYLNMLFYFVSSLKGSGNPPEPSEIVVYGLDGQTVSLSSHWGTGEALADYHPKAASELYYGFEAEPLSVAQEKRLHVPAGFLVDQVDLNGPAHRAGIRAGDVMVDLNGKRTTPEEVYEKDLITKDNVITVLRNGKRLSRRVTPVPDTSMVANRPDAGEMWQALMARSKSYWKPFLQRYRYDSTEPIPAGFTPKRIELTYSTQGKWKTIPFAVKDIPIPSELWEQRRLSKSALAPERARRGEREQDAKILAGATRVEGPGVIVTLQDSKQIREAPPGSSPEKRRETEMAGIVHDSDVRLVIDELFAAGAEAIAVNDQRVVARTAVRCVGPSIVVNDVKMGVPFTVKAIGSSKEIMAVLGVPAGLLDNEFAKLKMITARPSSHIVLPAYTGSMRVQYARVVK